MNYNERVSFEFNDDVVELLDGIIKIMSGYYEQIYKYHMGQLHYRGVFLLDTGFEWPTESIPHLHQELTTVQTLMKIRESINKYRAEGVVIFDSSVREMMVIHEWIGWFEIGNNININISELFRDRRLYIDEQMSGYKK